MRKKINWERFWRQSMVVCLVGFLVSAIFLALYLDAGRREQETFDQLAFMVEAAAKEDDQEKEGEEVQKLEDKDADEAAGAARLQQYAEIYTLNPDLVGWIQIEGTGINYPVMQSIEEPDYYLHRDFYGDYSRSGVPYLEEECDLALPSDNLLVYGHYLRNGTMFTDLEGYREEKFYREHPSIRFDTLEEIGTYQIIAVFRTVVYSDGPEAFPYYEYIDMTQEQFQEYVDCCKELSFYDTGETAESGDQLLTLSTCDFSIENGRLVVVARKVTENEAE